MFTVRKKHHPILKNNIQLPNNHIVLYHFLSKNTFHQNLFIKQIYYDPLVRQSNMNQIFSFYTILLGLGILYIYNKHDTTFYRFFLSTFERIGKRI